MSIEHSLSAWSHKKIPRTCGSVPTVGSDTRYLVHQGQTRPTCTVPGDIISPSPKSQLAWILLCLIVEYDLIPNPLRVHVPASGGVRFLFTLLERNANGVEESAR